MTKPMTNVMIRDVIEKSLEWDMNFLILFQ